MILLFFAFLLAQDTSMVEGTVVNDLTGEPLRKAHVVLERDKTRYAVVTGDEGKFRFEGIEPGEYQPEAERQGFLGANEQSSFHSFDVGVGEHVRDVVIRMTPESAIAGHVLDEDGDPVPEAHVVVERRIHVNSRVMVFDQEKEVTDNEGYFFASGLKAGRYYLTAIPPQQDLSQRGRPGPEEDLVRTEDPFPVDLITGTVARNVDVRIRKDQVFRIRGRVSSMNSGYLELMPTKAEARVDDGAFEFAGVAPGSYFVTDSRRPLCRVPITVGDHDVDGVVVDLPAGASIEGTVKIEGGGHFAKPPTVAFQSAPDQPNFRGSVIAIAKDDGTFEWTNLAAVRWETNLMPPEDLYVKSIQFNHQSAPDGVIDLTSCTGGALDIVFAPHAATVSATVHGDKNIKVTLWNDSTMKTKEADGGTTIFTNLAPGEYKVLAWERVDDEFLEFREFLDRFDAQKVTLVEGTHEITEVNVIPKSASDAEVAKLQ